MKPVANLSRSSCKGKRFSKGKVASHWPYVDCSLNTMSPKGDSQWFCKVYNGHSRPDFQNCIAPPSFMKCFLMLLLSFVLEIRFVYSVLWSMCKFCTLYNHSTSLKTLSLSAARTKVYSIHFRFVCSPTSCFSAKENIAPITSSAQQRWCKVALVNNISENSFNWF